MGFGSLLVVASMPVIQFLLIGLLGAFLASGYSNILSASARSDINKVAFVVFTPSIVFSSLAKTVTLQELISWWYMPVNIAITFVIGGIFGWLAVKILRPERHLEGLVISSCSTANLGNLPLIIVPALCGEIGSPFGEQKICRSRGLSYVSLSMSLGSLFIWTITYSLMRKSGVMYNKIRNEGRPSEISIKDFQGSGENLIVKIQGEGSSNNQEEITQPSLESTKDAVNEKNIPLLSTTNLDKNENFWDKLKGNLHQIVEELFAPATIATICGMIIGVIPWLKSLIIGPNAPLRVIQDTITTLGDGLLPSIILILGGNLTQGLRNPALKSSLILTIVVVRFVMLPIAGIVVVRAAYELGFLPEDPLYRYVLMLQFSLPPAMAIGTMAQLFDVAKEECSVIFLWSYLAAAFALTAWSTVFMWMLS